MEHYLQGIATVLGLVNPFICVALFLKLQGGESRSEQITAAVKAMVAVFVILALSAIFGVTVLNAFGISLSAFSVAGGLILAWMGFGMLSKKPDKPDSSDPAPKGGTGAASVTPLIMFAASPGTITGVITLSVYHSSLGLPLIALVSIGVACLVTLVLLVLAIRGSGGQHGESLLRDMMSRFMGLIVLAMGIQFALSGLKDFFSG
jgi:multiple antibiotic resistance protein